MGTEGWDALRHWRPGVLGSSVGHGVPELAEVLQSRAGVQTVVMRQSN